MRYNKWLGNHLRQNQFKSKNMKLVPKFVKSGANGHPSYGEVAAETRGKVRPSSKLINVGRQTEKVPVQR